MSEPPRESLFALGFGCGGYVGGLLVCFKAWCVLSRAPRVIRVRFAQTLVKSQRGQFTALLLRCTMAVHFNSLSSREIFSRL